MLIGIQKFGPCKEVDNFLEWIIKKVESLPKYMPEESVRLLENYQKKKEGSKASGSQEKESTSEPLPKRRWSVQAVCNGLYGLYKYPDNWIVHHLVHVIVHHQN